VRAPARRFDHSMIFAQPKHGPNAAPICGQRVTATPAAIDAILHLQVLHGHMTLHHRGGAIGDVEVHRAHRPLTASRHEACIGVVGGARFFVDFEEDRKLAYPDFQIDVVDTESEDGDESDEPRLLSYAVRREAEQP
jgi:uncharacterized protein (DUF779 family)